MIQNKFLYYLTKTAFQAALDAGEIQYESIVFIGTDRLIWNRGLYCGLSEFGDGRCKGFFITIEILLSRFPDPEKGDWAVVKINDVWTVVFCKKVGTWTLPPNEYEGEDIDLGNLLTREDIENLLGNIDLSNLATKNELEQGLAEKQDTLISAVNIKTVNGKSLLGVGDLWISEYGDAVIDTAISTTSTNPVLNKAIALALNGKVDSSVLFDYVKKTDLERYALASDLVMYATTGQLRDYAKTTDLSNYATVALLNTKQGTLISGENLKTINTQSLLGPGNITVLTPSNVNEYIDIDPSLFEVDLSEYAKKSEIETTVVNNIRNIIKDSDKSKGYFDSYEDLIATVPNPTVGDWAVVNSNGTWVICRCSTDGEWTLTTQEFKQEAIDLSNYVTDQQLAGVVSSVNITSNLLDDRISALKEIVNTLVKKYISWYGENAINIPGDEPNEVSNINLVTLTVQEYQNLVDNGLVRDNVYYFTYEAEEEPVNPQDDSIGTFPITLTEQWTFGGTFPIILH